MRRNDLTKIFALRDAGVLSIRSGINELVTKHDDDCPKLNDGFECTCDPDIYLHGKKLRLPRYN